jgi:hypothetical protein
LAWFSFLAIATPIVAGAEGKIGTSANSPREKEVIMSKVLSLIVVVTLVILPTVEVSGGLQLYNFNYQGWDSTSGRMHVYFNQNGDSSETSNMYWAYYISHYGVADSVWHFAYYGMGLDVLPLLGGGSRSVSSYVPTLYIGYHDTHAPWAWTDGFNLYLNPDLVLPSGYVNGSNWQTVLNTYAWWIGGELTRDMSHVFYRQVTGHLGASYWDNLLIDSIAYYVDFFVWPAKDPGLIDVHDWYQIDQQIRKVENWSYSGTLPLGPRFENMPTFQTIATTYNYGGTTYWRDQLHFLAFGYFLANYYDYSTGYKGPMGSYGYYSPMAQYGTGGSWNVGYLLWQMGAYGYSVPDALANVYSPSGHWYTPYMNSMPHAWGEDLNSRYYWYWVNICTSYP